jgi:hypothetical protein
VNALCTSFGLRPRRIARSWVARACVCIVALAMTLAGSPAVAAPSVRHADMAAIAHSSHCAASSAMHARSHDAALSCCTTLCPCVQTCALTPAMDARMRVAAAGESFRACVAHPHASIATPLLRPPIA